MIGYVVIGAGFGDEGKGLMTDYLVRRHKSKHVVRFNGGAQAGHTVQTPEGDRHVFGHVGAGTFAGAYTILGPKFIVNPLLLEKEAKALGGKFSKPIPFSCSPLSTIYDMILNAAVENSRGNMRHGSCGVGINETVTRHASFPLSVNSHSREMFRRIREEYFPKRWEELGKPELSTEMQLLVDIDSEVHYKNFKRILAEYMSFSINESADFSALEKCMIFEGAQGLELDEELGAFPHVTRSLTGLPQAIQAASKLGVKELIPVYVTRCYKTRHGAGALPWEGRPFSEEFELRDQTNVPNAFQGTMRTAPLSTMHLLDRIREDVHRSRTLSIMYGVNICSPELAITCIDQVKNSEGEYDLDVVGLQGQRAHINATTPGYVAKQIAELMKMHPKYYSTGPTHWDVHEFETT